MVPLQLDDSSGLFGKRSSSLFRVSISSRCDLSGAIMGTAVSCCKMCIHTGSRGQACLNYLLRLMLTYRYYPKHKIFDND